MRWAGAALASAVSVTLAQPVVHAPGYDLAREGTGERRVQLNAMELKPFDQSLWAHLSDWSNGPALSEEATHGKVVLIYTWTSYLPNSLRPIGTLNRAIKDYADKGLVIVGVHPATGWEGAGKVLEERKAAFVAAQDKTGAFRNWLKVDQDPDFYLVDRAGQLRFADLDTGAVGAAIELLINETAEQSADVRARIDREQADADRKFAQTYDIRQDFHLSDIPELPFAQPTEEQYAAVKWPKVKETEEESRRSSYGRDVQPGRLPQFEDLAFYPTKPEFKGRVVIAYFFNPTVPQSYQKFIAEGNRLQKAHGRDVVVLGVMSPKEDPNARNRGGQEAEKIDPVKWGQEFLEFARLRDPKHWLVIDPAGQFVSALNTDQRSGNQDNGVFAAANMTYVALVSSDGVIRWHGPRQSTWFPFMLDELLRVDPAVLERRKVEEDYRRARGG
ncbi:MAG: TlpA family protein disulfide reductase [Leptolyngbya sp. PLA3]|nr:MAG: TlpA family protein disulfide reductase [Cyanobacteria bacterium CYA]MCE7969856.1 TlpA family protein disulfide reductase [Leptolyngbya sp. PL-A3]